MGSADHPLSLDLPGVPPELLDLLAACAGSRRLAIVGGAVRDLLLHRVHSDPWRGLPDVDLVVEADAGEAAALWLAQALERSSGLEVLACREHGAYGTVEITLQCASAEQGPPQTVLVDVATARRERYPQPAGKPQVEFAGLHDDLARRDFSINAMAVLLDQPPQLLDPHAGQADLALRQLRFLHAGSVRDDPSRVLRAARYAARLGFVLAECSHAQLRDTLATWPWPWRPGDPPEQVPPGLGSRLRMELQLLLEHEPWPQALAALQQWGGLTLLDAGLQNDQHWLRRLRWGGRLGLPPLLVLFMGAHDPMALAQRLQIPQRQQHQLQAALLLRQRLADPQVALGFTTPLAWTRWLEGLRISPEAVALALAASVAPRRPLLRWWLRWRHCRAVETAHQLMAQGVPPGPQLGLRLRALREERLLEERL